jgi:hypothetical protein
MTFDRLCLTAQLPDPIEARYRTIFEARQNPPEPRIIAKRRLFEKPTEDFEAA